MTRILSLGVVLLVCFTAVFADEFYYLTADFIERKESDANAYTRGKVYYKFDGSCMNVAADKPKCIAKTDRAKSRILFQYDIGDQLIDNLYHYADGALYSMCTDSCSGVLLNHKADPWFYDSNYAAYYDSPVYDPVTQYNWYNRTKYGTNNVVTSEIVYAQVNRIAIQGTELKVVEFVDGRVVYFSNVNYGTIDESKFKVREGINCPKATCPIYADLVFVLDNSGSVSGTEWTQTTTFVNNVIDTFTFGDDAANVAVVQFNAPRLSNCHYYTYYWDCGKSSQCYCSSKYDPNYDCKFINCNPATYCNNYFPGRDTASLIAGKNILTNISTVTVSVDATSVKRNISGSRPSAYGNTCQGFGLELAYYVLKNSPRTRYGKRPQPIVIAVTDGQDFCPNKTKKEADRLRNEFGAFVIEVGVGMSYSCNNYDINFLKSVASYIGSEDNPAYYNVTDYNAIKDLSDKLFKPICDGFNGGCGPDCHGFCGCGKCMCPTCDALNSTCEEITCIADQSSSTGCKKKDIPCKGEENICEWFECDGTKTDAQGRCTKVYNKCEELKKANPGKCREVAQCTVPDGCELVMNDAYCNSFHHRDKCVEYECTPEGETPDFIDSGCRVKVNRTLNMEKELEKEGKWCAIAVCDPEVGVHEGTTCQLSGDPPKPLCYKPACKIPKGESSYKCVDEEYNRPPDSGCSTYSCDYAESGWQSQYFWENETCRRPCTSAKDCNDIIEEENNADPTTCHTSMCVNGYCSERILEHHADTPVDNICEAWKCVEKDDGTWEWKYTDTKLGANCKTDPCGVRECVVDGGIGCRTITDTCENNSNVCYKYTCEVTEDEKGYIHRKCLEESLLEVTHCTYEECAPDGQSKTRVYNLTVCNETLKYQCLKPICSYNKTTHTSVCEYADLKYTDVDPDATIDPCKLYLCDNDTGKWEFPDKCVDDDLCTENQCNVFGDCKFPEIQCLELSMDAYPCYYRQCIPDIENNKYICKRKHIKGAMIDLCGQCIMEKDEERHDVSSDSILHDSRYVSEHKSSSSSEINLVECTNAGPRPLLTEGLAAASIALIIIGAVVIGAGIAASGVIGTKTLIKRAKGANNQSAHSNPLFQENEAEMSNPAFIEDKEV